MGWVVFWLSVGAISLATTYAGYRGRQNVEATIRHAIDKGVIADAEAIATARAKGGVSWPMALIVLGIVHLFAALGIVAFSYFLGGFEPESVLPLQGVAAFTGLLAIGLLVSGIWLRHALAKHD